jgi:predicted DNA-binding transcriptional regulator YafY
MSEMVRLIRYAELLSNRRFMTKQDLMAKQVVSLATLKRDLVKLRDQMNVPIVFDRDLGGYKLDKTTERTELPGFWFSQDEILALLTIQNMIGELEPGLLGPKLKPLQTRLNSILASQGLSAETLTQRVRLLHAGKRRMPLQSFEAVAKGTLERKQVQILHLNRQSGEKLDRAISPQQLLYYRDNWYVDAWCHLRGGVRSFAIDAIETAQVLDKPAKELDPPTLKKHMSSGYGIFGGQANAVAKLQFSATRARWVQFEEWHPDQKGLLAKDGSYTLEVPYSDERELIGDILRFGADVKVLGPDSLVRQLRKELEKTLASYSKD